MTERRREASPPASDPDAGVYQGRSIARRFVSPDGLIVLVGRTAEDNDLLSLKLGAPRDFWLHVAGESGSHVVVRNTDGLDKLPKATAQYAAALAARYSKAKNAGRVAVHLARCLDVHKSSGMPPGQVSLHRHTTVYARPADIE